jgi:LacI family transcriptional regulator
MAQPSKKRPSQADVARLAGVAQATVSQVLNNNTTITISSETRKRIFDAVAELGYVPNHVARSFRTQRTETVALVVPDITNPFYPTFQRGIQNVTNAHGYTLTLFNTDSDAQAEKNWLEFMRRKQADGVIGVFFHLSAKELRDILEQDIYIVRFEAQTKAIGPLPLDTMYVDNVSAAYAATSYLIEKGHHRIGHIASQSGPGSLRIKGYREALKTHSLHEFIGETRGFTEADGYHAMLELLSLRSQPTAIFAANDLMAIGAIRAARKKNLRVPDDIAIVGFDDIPAAVLVEPQLTTITQFPQQLGMHACEMLFERLLGPGFEQGRCQEMPFELIIRESA